MERTTCIIVLDTHKCEQRKSSHLVRDITYWLHNSIAKANVKYRTNSEEFERKERCLEFLSDSTTIWTHLSDKNPLSYNNKIVIFLPATLISRNQPQHPFPLWQTAHCPRSVKANWNSTKHLWRPLQICTGWIEKHDILWRLVSIFDVHIYFWKTYFWFCFFVFPRANK